MEDLQTVLDTVTDYGKNQNSGNPDFSKGSENDCGENLLNGSDDLDPLGLMDHCDESIGSNSDVWKGSDSEDDSFEKEKAQTSQIENVAEENLGDTTVPSKENEEKGEPEAPERVQNVIESEETNGAELSKDQEEAEKEQETEKLDCKTGDAETSKDQLEAKNDKTGDVEILKDQEEAEEEQETEKLDCKTDDAATSIDQEEEKNEILDCKTGDVEISKVQDAAKNDKTGGADENSKDQAEVEKEPENAKLDSSAEVTATKAPEVSDGIEKANEEQKDPLAPQTSEDQPESSQGPLAEAPENSLEGTTPNCFTVDQDEDCQMDYDAEDDDDFDPSLLCPEVSMDVDENRVITNNGTVPNESGSGSPLPYEPLFSAFVDDVTGAEIAFNLTPEELELKKRLYGATNPIQYTRIHCTACNVHLGSALEGQNNRFVHPLLKVLICKECYHFYTSGEFEKDEDGSELYCRWCGQGGQVLCCSKCEFVFCKRCIRTNFGRKKMFEIRDSDSWECFRCNSSQLITQRIACYEFFEYIRREMAWAANANNQDLWSKDYSRCCGGEKKRAATGEEKKAKRKKSMSDPDYNPFVDYSKMSEPKTDPLAFGGNKVTLPKLVQIVPKVNLVGNKTKDNDIEFVRQIPAPHVTINPRNRPMYRTILPTVRPGLQPSSYVRLNPASPLVPSANRLVSTAIQNRNLMKHEWFEKTVRAAARVNSHLSYTLTQLNKAQSQAGSVEELAVVHNKLQEILSSSINSLIQIRKNLRTEFIAGIKTVHLPSKKPEQSDDDVIIVSPPTVMPKPATCPTKTAIDPLIIIAKPTNSKSTVTTGPQKGFLKVKSVSELQNVPPECITIPDDPPPVSEKPCNGGSPKVETYKVTDKTSVDIKKMMAVRVNVIREDLEKLQRQMKKES